MGIKEAIKQKIEEQLRINRKLKRIFRGEEQKKIIEFNSYYDYWKWKSDNNYIVLGINRNNGILEITYF